MEQVLSLAPDDADKSHPVTIHGVVTLFDSGGPLCFVQDATAGIYVYATTYPSGLKTGSKVEVRGESAAGKFSPVILKPLFSILGDSPLPTPRPTTIDRLATGREDSQWVSVEGVVRVQEASVGYLHLEVSSGSARLPVLITVGSTNSLTSLIDARVRINGVVAIQHNGFRQVAGFRLLSPGLDQVTVLEPPSGNPFELPLKSVTDLLVFSRSGAAEHQVRLRGVATLYQPGALLFLNDSSGSVRVQTTSREPISVGDVVEVAGFATLREPRVCLEDAILRKSGQTNPPPAITVHAREASLGALHDRLVQVEGVLLRDDHSVSNRHTLVLTADNQVFRASLPKSPSSAPLSLAAGSTLALTGICVPDAVNPEGGGSFQILLRSLADIHVRSTPPSAVGRGSLWFLVAGFGICLVLLIWSESARRRLQREAQASRLQALQLDESQRSLLENTHDVYFSLDLSGRIKSINKSGAFVLGWSAGEQAGLSVPELTLTAPPTPPGPTGLTRLGDPAGPGLELAVTARDGRRVFLEFTSTPEYEAGRVVGLRCLARDITRLKQTEAALLEAEARTNRMVEAGEQLRRDLHDGIIQSVYAIGLGLENCLRLLPGQPEEVKKRLTRSNASLNAVIREVRSFIGGAEPASLTGQEFRAALKSLSLTLGENHSARFHLEIDPISTNCLDPKQATNLLFIAREAMTNSVRHSKANSVIVSLQAHQNTLRFSVEDDGAGFILPESHSGFGLRNMQERALELGARFEINSSPGLGTRVVLEIPRQPSLS